MMLKIEIKFVSDVLKIVKKIGHLKFRKNKF